MLDSSPHNICFYFVRIFHDFYDALLFIDFHPYLFYITNNTYATLRTDEIYNIQNLFLRQSLKFYKDLE